MKPSDFTLLLIKPDALPYNTKIVQQIHYSGFGIVVSKNSFVFSAEEVRRFYEEHADKPFFPEHSRFMQSGTCTVYLLRQVLPSEVPAFEKLRQIVGSTDPTKAEEGTIRKRYGTNLPRNAVHASDSVEAVKREALFFFSGFDLIRYGAGELVP